MARQIIILDQVGLPSDSNYNVAFWLAVPAARQLFYANATAKSQVIGATANEVTAIQSGAVLEVITQYTHIKGTSLAAIEADLQAAYAAAQTALNNNNQFNHYGTSWDGTTWTIVTVA